MEEAKIKVCFSFRKWETKLHSGGTPHYGNKQKEYVRKLLNLTENFHHWVGPNFYAYSSPLKENQLSQHPKRHLIQVGDCSFYAAISPFFRSLEYYVMTRFHEGLPIFWVFVPNRNNEEEAKLKLKTQSCKQYYTWTFLTSFYAEPIQLLACWVCSQCTWRNRGFLSHCEMCSFEKPKIAEGKEQLDEVCSNSKCVRDCMQTTAKLYCFHCRASFCSLECYTFVFETRAHDLHACLLQSMKLGNISLEGIKKFQG